MSQPFSVAEQFTGIPGRYVKLEDTISSFERLVAGEFDNLPEQAFFMLDLQTQRAEPRTAKVSPKCTLRPKYSVAYTLLRETLKARNHRPAPTPITSSIRLSRSRMSIGLVR